MILKLVITTAIFLATMTLVNWDSSPDTASVKFTLKGPVGKVHGSFTGFKSELSFDPENPAEGQLIASIDAASVKSGVGLRDKHLREKSEWLDAEKFPLITYRSVSIAKSGTGWLCKGNLTLKGITHEQDINFQFKPIEDSGVFTGQFIFDREDYAVGDKGGTVGSKITIDLSIPVKKTGSVKDPVRNIQ